MAEQIIVPGSGELGDEITLVHWHKKEGEPVRAGELVAEIEAQKGVLEIEAHTGGYLIARIVQEGDVITPGDILGYIGASGEEIEKGKPAAPGIMPRARKRATEMGIDLSRVHGSGPNHTITVSDIEAHGGGISPQRKPADVLLSKNQSAVARAVSVSHRETPVIHLTAEIDMTRAKKVKERGIRFDALFIKISVEVLPGYPKFHWVMDESGIRESASPGVGYAVSVHDDLYTPVLPDPRGKSLKEIDADLGDCIAGVSRGSVSADELKGFTLLLSNLGMYGITAFDAIIPPGAAAALTFGSIREATVVLENEPVVRPVMTVTLTVDHRIINGAYAARFLKDFKTRMETFEMGTMEWAER